jgi:tRNA nucleotidyltransferase (CCA-adding enzyme)
MLNQIPTHITAIQKTFTDANFDIYLVGGCVRDLLQQRKPTDWDLTTNATPEQMLALFPDGFYDNVFGTVGIPVPELLETEHKGIVEITTFRTEKGYKDRRHPEKIAWGKTIEEDLSRRDFTMNAIAIKITGTTTTITDPYNGQEDLTNKIIRAVGDPALRFKEDALRMMRAIRFAAQLGFQIEEQTLTEITKDASLLAEIAKERVKDELLKFLASDYPYEGIMLLKNTTLLEHILPELLTGIGISQARPGRHHTDDVFTHNVLALKYCPSSDPVVRFATLLHDVGKPTVQATDEEDLVIFHNHEVAGANLAYQIANRLRFSKKDRQKICKLIRWHMFTVDEHITDSAIRRFIRHIGVENVKDMMDLRVGDRLGGGTQRAESWRLKLFKQRVEDQLAPTPFSINDLAIDGHDIMKELQMKPSRKVGELLQTLFEEVDEDLSKNTKEYLLKRVKEL